MLDWLEKLEMKFKKRNQYHNVPCRKVILEKNLDLKETLGHAEEEKDWRLIQKQKFNVNT